MDVDETTGPRLVPPAVRARAAELGIATTTLETLTGTGPGGRLRLADLGGLPAGAGSARASSAVAAPAAAVTTTLRTDATGDALTVPLGALRWERARRVMEDATAAADLTSAVEVDLTATIARLEQATGIHPGSATFPDEFLTIVARNLVTVLRAHPMLNARIDMATDGGRTILRDAVDLGVTISGERGDIHGVIGGAESLAPDELRARLGALGLLARAGVDGTAIPSAPSSADSAQPGPEATFTLIDRRSRPVLFETPPLPRGCSGALAVGAVEKRPLIDPTVGGLRIAWAAYLCLTYDHRLVDGADAARFLAELSGALASDGQSG